MAYKFNPFTSNFDAVSGGVPGPTGVVTATAPISYDSGTQTVSTSMTTNRLLGRSTAGTGVAEEISIGSGLSLSAGTLTATGGGGGAFTGGTLTSNLTLAAGTTSLSPLTLQSGTNLTTATAGAFEYDGRVIYSTPSGRGVSPSMMFYRLNSGFTGSNATGAQSIFGVGITLAANTVYAFEIVYTLTKSVGTNSHAVFMLIGGTATLNNILYQGVVNSANSSIPTLTAGASSFVSNTASSTSIGGTLSGASQSRMAQLSGTVSVNTGGTFIPQYSLNAAPGGPYITAIGSYIAIWPIGVSGSNTSVGPWA